MALNLCVGAATMAFSSLPIVITIYKSYPITSYT